MMTQSSSSERRQHPRLFKNIPLKIKDADGDIVSETGNISASGAYCRVSKYMEPMTKLQIHFLIPVKKQEKSDSRQINCEGVVVRVEPITGEDESYNVAVFFNDISKRDSEFLKDYVNSSL